MNAYELADKGLNSEGLKHPELWNLCIEMSRMLRQQADRIAQLEMQLEHAYGLGEAGGFIKGHKAASQTKPLSDEEICKAMDCIDWAELSVWDTDILIVFARAIEAKVRGDK